MKKLKILTLLILSLGLILCFSNIKTKAYYETEGSYLYVYINGTARLRVTYDTMQGYLSEEGIASNGWPTSWMTNSYTSGMTFDGASWDVSGNQVIDTFGVVLDTFFNAFTFAGVDGVFSTNVYLWFSSTSSTPKYATLKFTYTAYPYQYESIIVTWNTDNVFKYSDFPTVFYNNKTGKYDTITGGHWFNDDTLQLLLDDYLAFFVGGKTYNFDYYVSGDVGSDTEEFDETKWNSLNVPTVLYADEQYAKLPTIFDTYTLVWSLLYPAVNYVEFGTVTDTFIPLYRLQPLNSSITINLQVMVVVDDTYYTHEYSILIQADVTKLEAPVLEKIQVGESFKLQWNFVENAAGGYAICLGNEEDEIIATVNPQTNTYFLPGALDVVGHYTLYVKALSAQSHYTDSNLSNGVSYYFNSDYRQLSTPVLTLTDHTLSWQSSSLVQYWELYCNLNLVRVLDADITSFDIYDLNLDPGTYEFRLVALAADLENYENSKYSEEVTFTQKKQSINFYINNTLYKSIYPSNLKGEDNISKKEYFIANLLPKEISLEDGKVGIVQSYYLDKELTDEIDSSIIYNSWSAINYEYLEIYMDVIQPLDYNGPTLIWKNPASLLLDKDTITKHVRIACEEGTKDNFTLTLKTDGYTGHGDSPGSYNMVYECKVGDYVSTINLVVRVSASIKVDYLFNDSWYCSTIVAKPDIVSTAKAVGSLPETELAYTIVTYHNDSGEDYYSSKPTTGAYSFLITFNSTSGEKGFYRFEMNYGVEPDYEFQEEKTNILPIIFTIGGITVTIVVVVLFYKKVLKPFKKTKNKRNFHYKERRKYYRKRGLYR